MPQLTTKPLGWFKPDPKQPRKNFDEVELRQLGESLKRKQLQPVLTQPDGTIIAGERRWRAAQIVGMASLEVKVADEQLSETQLRAWQLIENMQRADLSGYEQWLGCAELMCGNPTWQMKDLAEQLSLSQPSITKILSPSKLSEDWQESLKAGNVTLAQCYSASKADKSKHAGLLALALQGATRDALDEAVRPPRTQHPEASRVQRVKCDLPGGVSVVVSGQSVSLDESIDALGNAIKEMKRARELGYTAKTFAAAMKDRAKVG